jgi:hypothetical protein
MNCHLLSHAYKIIGCEDSQLDVVREMHWPHRNPEVLGCRGEAAGPTAIGIIHGVAPWSGEQERNGSVDTLPSNDVLTQLQQRAAAFGVSPAGDLFDLYKLRIHHGVGCQESNPEPWLAETKWCHQSAPTKAQVCGVVDGRHLFGTPHVWNGCHGPTLSRSFLLVHQLSCAVPRSCGYAASPRAISSQP